MAAWCAEKGVRLAPHGKTTMAPALFRLQIDAGAWAITLATPAQVAVARRFGFSRILLANELVDPLAIAWLAEDLAGDPAFELYCFVDSVAGAQALSAGFAAVPGRVGALLEVGLHGGRAGCRSLPEAMAVAGAVRDLEVVRLAGVAGWEGAYGTGLDEASLSRVRELLESMRTTTDALAAAGHFDGFDEVIVSAGGSAYVDLVVATLTRPWDFEVAVVVRSGAYVTHDHQHYQHLSPFGERSSGPVLLPALHAWGRVLSRPEPRLAILDLGKRDVPYDLDLPVPLDLPGARTVSVNDQHLFLELAGDDLEVGDVVRLGLSHPCTAFDKWQLIPMVRHGVVVELVRTYF
jgi:D-serine deaminase-like pyridoxal phosphate-dependent protein